MSRKIYVLLFMLTAPLIYGQTSLQYTLQKGEVFTIKQEALQQITQEIEGSTHEITNRIEGVLEFKVVDVHETTYDITVSFKDLQLYMYSSTEGQLMDINAAEAEGGDMQAKIFNSLLNVPISVVLDRRGEVLSVSGGDSLVERMAKASGVEDNFTLELIKESLDKDFGSDALSNSYEQMTFIYPNTEIRIGESWENKYKGKISSNNHWTLNGLKNGHATIMGHAEVVMDLQDEAASMSLEGNRKTELSADLSSGFLVAMKVVSQSSGVSAVREAGAKPIPTTIKSTITYKRI